MPGSGNTSPKDMESLLPLMSMVIYCIDKAKKFRLNREVSSVYFTVFWILYEWQPLYQILNLKIGSHMFLVRLSEIVHPSHGEPVLTAFAFLCAKGKQKADKNRARVEENFLKLTHVQRQEAAQSRREEKKRAEKERIMNEEDPEKQRRLEVRWICYCEISPMVSPGLHVGIPATANFCLPSSP